MPCERVSMMGDFCRREQKRLNDADYCIEIEQLGLGLDHSNDITPETIGENIGDTEVYLLVQLDHVNKHLTGCTHRTECRDLVIQRIRKPVHPL